MKKVISQIVLMLIAVVLMMLPSGIKSLSSGGAGLDFVNYYSYFSPMNFGYGNWAPLITLLLSLVVIVLFVISIKRGSVQRTINTMLILCISLMLISSVIFSTYTAISLMVMIIHAIILMINNFNLIIKRERE